MVGTSSLVMPCLDLSFFGLTSFLLDLLLSFLSASSYCFTKLFSFARVYGIHTACMESPFPILHAKWSLVFRSVNKSILT